MENIYIGIDFGNINIKVGIWNNKKKEAKAFNLGKAHGAGDKILKNYIYYSKDNQKILGDSAIKQYDIKNSVNNIKSKLSIPSWTKKIENIKVEKNIIEVISDILLEIKKDIESKHGDTPIKNTAITVPVNFSNLQKDIIQKSCDSIGLPVESIITESVAACIGLDLYDDIMEEDKTLVFDFGGGTIDLAIFHYKGDEEDSEIDILSSYGIKYGGKDIDRFIYEEFIYPSIDMSKFEVEEREGIIESIMIEIEKTKEELFLEDEEETSIYLTDGDLNYKHSRVDITIKKEIVISYFEEIKIKERIFKVIEQMLEEADLELEDIKRVKMVGGSSRIKYFQEILSDYFKDDEIVGIDEMEEDDIYYAVALGACKYLVSLVEEDCSLKVNNVASYEILFFENGNYKKVVEKNAGYEFYSPLKPLNYKKEKKIQVFQGFCNIDQVEVEKDKVYIGDIICDLSKYSEDIYYRIGTNKKGEITCRLFDSKNPSKLVEEIWI